MARYTARYVHKISPSEKDVAGPFEIADGAFSNRKTLGKALRDCGALMSGTRIQTFRVEGGKIVIFPTCPGLTTYWHAIVLTSAE